MVFINEWLPNPAGNDAQNEWVELFNDGSVPAGSHTKEPRLFGVGVNLRGWVLKTQSGSKAKLRGVIGADEYLILKRSATKLVLKNSDEKLFLYDAKGSLADQSGFLGVAAEGKSFSRLNSNELTSHGAKHLFIWADPTPGARNNITLDTSIIKNNYPYGVALNHPFGKAQLIGLLLGSSIVLAAIIFYAVKKHENLSNLFFERDEEAWL